MFKPKKSAKKKTVARRLPAGKKLRPAVATQRSNVRLPTTGQVHHAFRAGEALRRLSMAAFGHYRDNDILAITNDFEVVEKELERVRGQLFDFAPDTDRNQASHQLSLAGEGGDV